MTEEAPVWQMPPVRIGQPILFFPFGERNGKPPHMGYIVDVKRTTVKLKTLDGEYRTAVRYIDDPQLKDSPDQRKDLGAWDYTEEERTEKAWKTDIQTRLAQIEKQVAGLIAGKKEKA